MMRIWKLIFRPRDELENEIKDRLGIEAPEPGPEVAPAAERLIAARMDFAETIAGLVQQREGDNASRIS